MQKRVVEIVAILPNSNTNANNFEGAKTLSGQVWFVSYTCNFSFFFCNKDETEECV